jgi:serine/threonine-protein kinase RsbT
MTPNPEDNHGEVATLPLKSDEDVVRIRQFVREKVVALGFGLADQTKVVTAASELARNTLRYGGGGEARVMLVQNAGRRGVKLDFVDNGPGIADVDLALRDGYTTGGGLGMGLGGSKRLCDEFSIDTSPNGTTVSVTKWTRT